VHRAVRAAALAIALAGIGPTSSAFAASSDASAAELGPAERSLPSVRAVVRAGYDVGRRTEASFPVGDGSDARLVAGAGLWLSAGLLVAPSRSSPLELEATLGYKHEAVRTASAGLSATSSPLDLAATWRLGAFRLGGGARLALAQRRSGSGAASRRTEQLETALGPLVAAELVSGRPGESVVASLGLRAAWMSVRSSGGIVHSATVVGLTTALAF
jgi:hypothetical protein